ncbi:short-chain dehydrogenase [Wolfiporia cocos MD-104 SS10]|uniref:Short-chain dehydrogenase n=1 Tax=Wolfiporia cocos (strain MD-104) TaxID=742152 RepID=A0A2H3JTC0_WOLCO|nr:short-chain dehydrogenase [Wolfiporia cocos MD-104 SS10]
MPRRPTVIITGASKGLGLAAAKILLTEYNANVVALSRTDTLELVELCQAHADALLVVKGDVTDATVVSHTVASAIKVYGHIDALILNAAVVTPLGRIADEEISLDAWKAHFDVNFFSLVTAVRAALPALRASDLGGRVVFVSSGSATKGTPTMGPYNASKAAMNSLCRTLAEEEPDVTCVAMRPGTVDTQMQIQLRELGATALDEKVHAMFMNLHTGKKLLKSEDAGYVVASLSLKSPKSMSGQFVSWDADDLKDFRRA